MIRNPSPNSISNYLGPYSILKSDFLQLWIASVSSRLASPQVAPKLRSDWMKASRSGIGFLR